MTRLILEIFAVPVAEIAAAITSFRASLDIAKAMVTLRDQEAFRAKSIELVHQREQTKAPLEAIRRTKQILPSSPRLGEVKQPYLEPTASMEAVL
jgi:hypothetical protein